MGRQHEGQSIRGIPYGRPRHPGILVNTTISQEFIGHFNALAVLRTCSVFWVVKQGDVG
jgi:hypothetical protein